MAVYEVQYVMPVWYTVTFEAEDGLDSDGVWEKMVELGEHHNGEECGWSYDKDFWNDAIENSEACLIRNIDEDEPLFTM